MNHQTHLPFGAAAILAAAVFLAACSSVSKSREGSAEDGGHPLYYGSNGTGMDSANPTYPYGPDYRGNPGMGGTGTLLLDTVYQRDTAGIYGSRSDPLNPSGNGNPGTGLPGSKGRGGSGLDTLRGPDSMHRDTSLIFPDAYPGTGAPGTRPEGGSGQGGTRDSMDPDRINDSLGVLDWYERG
jgi:hypothetical protein